MWKNLQTMYVLFLHRGLLFCLNVISCDRQTILTALATCRLVCRQAPSLRKYSRILEKQAESLRSETECSLWASNFWIPLRIYMMCLHLEFLLLYAVDIGIGWVRCAAIPLSYACFLWANPRLHDLHIGSSMISVAGCTAFLRKPKGEPAMLQRLLFCTSRKPAHPLLLYQLTPTTSLSANRSVLLKTNLPFYVFAGSRWHFCFSNAKASRSCSSREGCRSAAVCHGSTLHAFQRCPQPHGFFELPVFLGRRRGCQFCKEIWGMPGNSFHSLKDE